MSKNFLDIIFYLNNNNINIEHSVSDDLIVSNIASLQSAQPSNITFFNDQKLLPFLKITQASFCIIKDEFKGFLPTTCQPLIVDNPYLSFAHLTNFFSQAPVSNNIIDRQTSIHKNSILANDIQIDPNVIIYEKTIIKSNVIIYGNSTIGPNVTIKENSIIYPNCKISNTIIGKNCLIQSGSIIGDKGFGFDLKSKIELKHIGNVVISDNVQIGSNTTIDRAMLDSTFIGKNVRIDNLVHIAHGNSIGDNTVIAGQVGIAGSVKIGKKCIIGGQVGIAGHIVIGDNVIIAAKSGVTKNIKDNSTIAGFPAIDIKKWKKNLIRNRT